MNVPRKAVDSVLLALFVVVLGLPATGALLGVVGGESITAREQRARSPWPGSVEDLAALRAWPGGLESWFDDRFALRDPLILLHNTAKALLGVSPSDLAIIGRDGWLFIDQSYLVEANRGAVPFAGGELQALLAYFVRYQEHLRQRGIVYLHVTPPDKQTLYADYLPGRIRRVGPSRYSQWRAAALASPLNFVDVEAPLAAAEAAGEIPYFQTDSHWNCRGAFVAYEQILDALGKLWEGPLRTLTYDDVRFEPHADPQGRDLARNAIGVPSLFPESRAMRCAVETPADTDAESLATGEALTPHQASEASRASRVVNGDFPEGPRVLVLRDSYGNAMTQFLNQSFREVIYRHRDSGLPSDELLDELAPDIVIYEHVERSLVGLRRRLQP